MDTKFKSFTKLTIFNSPILSGRVLIKCLADFFMDIIRFGARYMVVISTVAAALVMFFYI